ncbi:MAG TPA: VCBS repeat-containing protein, partial [Blastocatellia bacterium]|nr:VCBS repeat-containing protein [Blastocatellia bacterium]
MSFRLSVALLLVCALIGPVMWRSSAAGGPQQQEQQQQVHQQKEGAAAAKSEIQLPPLTGWFQRPAGAGDYQTDIPFPDLERPSVLADYLPTGRDIPGLCRALTHAYSDVTAQTQRALAQAASRGELDPEALQLPRLYGKLGDLAAYNGDLDTAVKNLETAYRLLNQSIDFMPNGNKVKLFMQEELGVAYMKQGELQNCRLNHNAQMCIFPLNAEAQHKLTGPSQKAIEYFTEYLKTDPKNLEVRWLLNVASMTLGKYPGGVPKEFLIPQSAFESKEDIGRFTDVAGSLGVDAPGGAGGVIIDDFDNDGFLDIVESSVDPCDSLHYFHNNGDGTFSDWTQRAGLAGQTGGLNIIQTDYNNDGWIDLFVMRGGWDFPMRNSLLRNNGDGTFTDVTIQSGLDTGPFRTHSVAWADFDNDGYVDVFIGHELGPSQLFRNKGDGTFEDVSHAAGVDKTAFTKGAVWGDYDNDGYPDLYVSNYAGDNFLYHNNGNGTFTDVAKQLHVEKPLMSFPCWFFDYDNDGFLDLFVASFVPSVT